MKILIVDDYPLIREGLGQLLRGVYPHIDLLHAGTGAQAVDALLPHRDIDLVLLDYKLPDMTGLEVLREFARVRPRLAVLVISGWSNPQLMQQTFDVGARGFVLKSGNTDKLLEAIDLVLGGSEYVPPELKIFRKMSHAADGSGRLGLSPRQETVLHGLLDGHSNHQIAQALELSDETVKSHVTAILRYFNADNRTQAVLAAVDAGYSKPKAA